MLLLLRALLIMLILLILLLVCEALIYLIWLLLKWLIVELILGIRGTLGAGLFKDHFTRTILICWELIKTLVNLWSALNELLVLNLAGVYITIILIALVFLLWYFLFPPSLPSLLGFLRCRLRCIIFFICLIVYFSIIIQVVQVILIVGASQRVIIKHSFRALRNPPVIVIFVLFRCLSLWRRYHFSAAGRSSSCHCCILIVLCLASDLLAVLDGERAFDHISGSSGSSVFIYRNIIGL